MSAATSTEPRATTNSISADPDKTRAALQNIINFIESERSYVNITNQYKIINLADTMRASHTTYADARILGQDLAALFDIWNQLQPSDSDEAAEATIRKMVVQIDTSSKELDCLKQASSNLNVASNEVIGELENVSQNLQDKLTQEEQQIQSIKASLAATAQEINHINDQLSGSSGFWEGFKTGISLGIYSGLRDKLSKQKELQSQYNSQLLQLQRTSQQTRQDAETINQLNQVLSSVSVLDTCIVSLENTMNTLITLAQQTEHDGDRITGTENGKVAQFFRNKFNNDMTALLEWQNVFPA